MNEIDQVVALKQKHQHTWQDKPNWFWLLSLLEEVGELVLSLVGLHRHSPEVELRQIASIAINWLEKRNSKAEN